MASVALVLTSVKVVAISDTILGVLRRGSPVQIADVIVRRVVITMKPPQAIRARPVERFQHQAVDSPIGPLSIPAKDHPQIARGRGCWDQQPSLESGIVTWPDPGQATHLPVIRYLVETLVTNDGPPLSHLGVALRSNVSLSEEKLVPDGAAAWASSSPTGLLVVAGWYSSIPLGVVPSLGASQYL